MVDSGTGAAAYYADVLQAVVTLAVTAPGGPPLNTAGFLDRLDARWLGTAWDPGRHPAEPSRVRGAARHLPDIQLRYATLLERLGPALDGPGNLADADAWYCILEGTREPSVAEAQAMALTELTAHAATDLDSEPRAMLLAADDYSAVSGKVPLSNLYERGRSLGIGVQVSAQSWQGLGMNEDERYKIAGTADGGIFVLHVPFPRRWSPRRHRGRCWTPRANPSAAPGAVKGPPASGAPGPPTPTSSAAWKSARRATSSAARPPSSRSPGPGPPPSHCSRRPPRRTRRRGSRPPPRTDPAAWPDPPAGLDDVFRPEPPGEPRPVRGARPARPTRT